MNKLEKLEFRPIQRISPSQFYSMKNCAYKSILAEATNKKPLLPISSNAYYGNVLHKMLELISKGEVRDENDFNRSFDEQVKLMEDSLIKDGYHFFVPLKKKVKDFTMKMILLKTYLQNISTKKTENKYKFIAEKWYSSRDGLIGGKIDLVIEGELEIKILDFKTGAITQDFLDDDGEKYFEVKEQYKDQLKIYAHLYYENTGKLPTQLSLVDLTKHKFDVEFSADSCKLVYEEAKSLLRTTNTYIEQGTFKANPNKENCKYCLYRPACSFYLKFIENDYTFNDLSGLVKNVTRFQNGNVSIYLEINEKIFTLSNFTSEMFPDINFVKNKRINIFNLKKESRDFFYSAIKTTTIYEQ
jgi:CRISPR/Cas system-associated exonuclease Cas4 (RecB family)